MSLGSPIGFNSEYKFFKKLEMPEPDFDQECVLEDYCDIHLRFTDNGDDKVWVRGSIIGKNSLHTTLTVDKFIPKMEPQKIMIAGSGSSIVL